MSVSTRPHLRAKSHLEPITVKASISVQICFGLRRSWALRTYAMEQGATVGPELSI